MINKIEKSIYFPDILDGSTMLQNTPNNHSFYKGSFIVEDENVQFKTKLFLGINKLIELANIFECVYLDKIEFIFLIKDFYKRNPSICIELLESGRISFINADKYFMYYSIEKEENVLRIYSLPKVSNDELIKNISEFVDDKFLRSINYSISKSIESKPIDAEAVTKQCSNDIRNGYYQGLAIGMNWILNINEDNKELYDLVAQLTLDKYVCNLYGIEAIYLKPYFYWADKYKNTFLNSIYLERSIFRTESIPNITFAVASCTTADISNDELIQIAESVNKQIIVNSDNHFDSLKEVYSSEIADDYANSVINFVDEKGAAQILNYLPFENYRQDLERNGKASRTTRSFIKIVPKEFLFGFLSGNIKFSKPIEFTKSIGTKGQNDITEAVFKTETINNERTATRNVYDLNYTNICCFYGLDNYMFVKTKTDKGVIAKATIKKEYFHQCH